jgi:hypothetical protein
LGTVSLSAAARDYPRTAEPSVDEIWDGS